MGGDPGDDEIVKKEGDGAQDGTEGEEDETDGADHGEIRIRISQGVEGEVISSRGGGCRIEHIAT
jgi:hypothetical protein